jgi:competence protein ComEA
LLPGIGPRRAALIVERRASDGPYRSLADLRDIAGLPRATVERLMPHLYVAPERTPR